MNKIGSVFLTKIFKGAHKISSRNPIKNMLSEKKLDHGKIWIGFNKLIQNIIIIEINTAFILFSKLKKEGYPSF